jgi:crotonobetainyl-CoA:carnitine CoA-transferase CaiB-like acyl-CoA transferase
MTTPLSGIRIIDCTRLLPGGFCTMLLADLGADVIKVEEPGRGDYIRLSPPFKGTESYMHLVLNRNKRSLTLNLKHPEGVQILKQLVLNADVLIEGNRPGVMDRLGVGYRELAAVNPGLIYCAITGYGQEGPYVSRAGHDLNYMGYAGALELFGEKEGPPVTPGLTVADIGGGAQMAIIGILSALLARHHTGKGQFIDVAMTDGVVYWLTLFAGWYFGFEVSPKRGEHVLLGQFPCYAVYPASDGFITVGCLEPQFWAELCKAVGREAYIDEQWSFDKAPDIFEDLANLFRTKSRAEWVTFFADKNVCIGPSNLIHEAAQDPHLRHRRMFVEMEHPALGPIRQLGIPIKFSATPGAIRTPPPMLGEHTEVILRSLGMDLSQINEWRAAGVV